MYIHLAQHGDQVGKLKKTQAFYSYTYLSSVMSPSVH